MEIFTRKWSEISGGRFDAVSHKQSHLFANSKYGLKKIKEICEINPSVNMSKFVMQDKNVSFIPMELLSNDGKSFTMLSQNASLYKGFTRFQNDDLLWAKITPCMQNKKSAVVSGLENGVGFGSTEFFVLRTKNSNIVNIHFILQILRMDLVIEQAKLNFKGSAGQQRVPKDFLENLLIPIPPKEIQEQIIDIMDNAYLEKKCKESEAQKILDSIDSFLLAELGINLLPKATSDLKKRIFFVKLSEISGKRFDCEYHQSYYKALEEAIQKGKYQTEKIQDSVFVNQQLEYMEKYNFINYIDLSCIDKENGIIKDTILINLNFPSRARQKVHKGDLLVSTLSGSMKAIALIEEYKENLIASTGFFVINKVKNISKDFLISILRTDLFQILLKRMASGSIMSSINYNDFLNLKIPLPPLSVQEKIADEITKRKQKALNLQKEAKECLNSAKIQVEKIILGQQQKD